MINERGYEMKLKLFSLLLLIYCSASFSGTQDYWTIDEYLKLRPEQKVLMKRFSQVVRETAKPVSYKKNIKVAIIYPGKQISDYWRRSVLSFRKRLEEVGLNVFIEEHFTRPGVEIRKQTKSIMKTLSTNPDYLIFTLDAKKHEKLIGKLLNKGNTKIILQNITTPRKAWGDNQPFFYVGFDHLEGSKLLADYYIKKTKGKGEYSLLYFAKGYVSEMRGEEFIKYIRKNSKLKLRSTYHTKGNFDKAKKATDDLIANKQNVKFVYACSTDIALGILESAKQNKKLGSFLLNGWGGGSSELDAIVKGELDVTVMRMNDDNGVAMAEAIKFDVVGKAKMVPTIYSGDFRLVKKGVSKTLLKKYKDWAFRYTSEID